jgi:predicted nucleotidyltransferase
MNLDQRLKEMKAQILEVAARHGARNVRVFGSVARGEAGPESDVDLLVDPGPGSSLLTQAALERELEALLGWKVNVVSERGLRERVRSRVLQDAVPL